VCRVPSVACQAVSCEYGAVHGRDVAPIDGAELGGQGGDMTSREWPGEPDLSPQRQPEVSTPSDVGQEWPAPSPADPVRSIMVHTVLTIDAGASLREVAEALHRGGVGALVVTEGAQPSGVVSERDVVRALAEGGDPDAVWAGDSMTPDPIWADPEQTIAEVAEQMRLHEIRHVPVRQDGQLAGIVSMRDVLDVLLPG